MSLLPLTLDPALERPSRLLDQQFGLGLDSEDLLAPLIIYPSNRLLLKTPLQSYIRPWRLSRSDLGSTLLTDKDKFQVSLDVQQFAPNELSTKLCCNNTLLVEGKHEEKQDEHGFVSRQFIRRYVLPEGLDVNQLQSKLSSDGVLTISAPKLRKEESLSRVISIQQTGQPIKLDLIKTEEKTEAKQEQEEKK